MPVNSFDNFGQWTTSQTFAPEGAEVGPDGEVISNAWSGGHPENGASSTIRPSHDSQTHRNANDSSVDGDADGASKAPSGVQEFDFIEPIPLGEDPELPLNARDVCAFICNKMIGTGIFVQPPAVLLLTRSKGEALGLWVLGFVYTLVSMILYIEFSRKLPHTGGELVYLDETLPSPRLFAYTIYSFYFIFMYNTATNSLQFANQVLISANAHTPAYSPDPRLLRFIAIVALSLFCLLHYFSGRAGRTLNQLLAFFKVSLLVIVLFAGIVRASHHFENDWDLPANRDKSSSAAAFLLIVFSFTGWENATFVSGEIQNHKILRRGFVSAVFIVGILYILVNLVFLLAVPYSVVENGLTAFVPLFFGGGFKARLTWSFLISFSASGSLLSVIYTCARVKQVIGLSNVVPWSKIWRMPCDSMPVPIQARTANVERTEHPTPKGGLILHWVCSVVIISATSRIKVSEAIGFPGGLQAYASGWVGIFISIGFPFLFLREKFYFLKPVSIPETYPTRDWNDKPELWILRSITGKVVLTLVYLAFNIYVVVDPIIPPYEGGNGKPRQVQGWWYLAITLAIMAAGTIYYYAVFGLTTNPAGDVNPDHQKRTIMRLARVYPKLHEAEIHEPHYGVRRWVEVAKPSVTPSYLYWFFGGSDRDHFPDTRVVDAWNRLMGR